MAHLVCAHTSPGKTLKKRRLCVSDITSDLQQRYAQPNYNSFNATRNEKKKTNKTV